MRNDQKLINDFVGAAQSAGLESLDYPAGRLIDQHLASKYPDHYKLGAGTEGLIVLAAVIGGGYLAYKKLFAAKKIKPIVDRTKDLLAKLEKQYPTDFADKRKPVEGEVKPINLVKNFKGTDLRAIATSIKGWMTSTDKELDALLAHTVKVFNDANEAAGKCKGADEEQVKAISDEIRKKYGNAPYETKFKSEFPGGTGQSISPISPTEYSDARGLLIELIKRFDKVNDVLFDDMAMGYVDDVEGADAYLNGLIQFDTWFDEVGGAVYSYIDDLLATAKDIEDYIIKSFK